MGVRTRRTPRLDFDRGTRLDESLTSGRKAFDRRDGGFGVTWDDLFDRAERYDRTEADILDALRRARGDDADD